MTDPAPTQSALNPETFNHQVLELWLAGRPPTTQRAYRASLQRLLAAAGRPLHQLGLRDLQDWAASLRELAPSTRCRHLSAVRSCLRWAHQQHLLPADAGAALRSPPRRDTLAERILTETEATRLIEAEPSPRNRAALQLLYYAGLRVSELIALRWRDLQARGTAGQIAVYGKGGRSRSVLLPAHVWQELQELRGHASSDEPVIRSRQGDDGGALLDPSQVLRIVRAAARRAGIAADVSPHWLRHAHASHALDRGAPIHLVQQTLGHASIATTGRYLHARPSDSSGRYLQPPTPHQ